MRCYLAPPGKERGISFGLACLINLRGGVPIVVVFINVGLLAGFPTALAGLFITMVSVPCLL